MLIRRPGDIRSSEITDEQVYLRRREFMRLAGAAAITGAVGALTGACGEVPSAAGFVAGNGAGDGQSPLANIKPGVVTTDEKQNSFEDITSYNNFYEFGTGKNDPAQYAGRHEDVAVDGEDRRLVQQAGELPARGPHQAVPAGGARLPPAVRRSVVDGHPVGGHSAQRRAQARRAAGQGGVCRVHDAESVPRRCPGNAPARSSGRTSRGCGWTKRCTR